MTKNRGTILFGLVFLLSLALPAGVQAEFESTPLDDSTLYSINLGWVSGLMPFNTANLYEPDQQVWYSAEKNGDILTVSLGMLSNPDVTLYPTTAQMNEYRSLAREIRENGMAWNDVGRLMKLWYQVKKGS